MAKKSRGFIQLEWECEQCSSRNPGPVASCENCGAPQPENVEFVAPSERKFVEDEKSLAHAKAGADIICAFCDTRNIATAEVCSQCGADLGEGARRKAGAEVRQREAATTLHCHNCQAENLSTDKNCQQCGAPLAGASLKSAPVPQAARNMPPTPSKAKKPKMAWILGIILFLLICCVAGAVLLFSPAESISGSVRDVRWETQVKVEQQQEAYYSNERGDPPSDAYDLSCRTEIEEVCSEKTVDQGNGYAEVVEECYTESEQYCSYTVLEWQTVETLTLDGDDYAPYYAEPSLTSDQRLGKQELDLMVDFDTEKGLMEYSPSDLDEYQRYQIGSQWTLTLNRFGDILSVKP